ncbi:MAG TPA: ABC transporter permease subunit, partial [Anaerolineae bacterium]
MENRRLESWLMIAPGWRTARIGLVGTSVVEKSAPLAFVAVAWELVARLGWVDPLFLPRFSGVLGALWSGLFVSGFLVTDAAYSLMRAMVGLAIGGTVGVLLGTLMGQFRPVRVFLDPLVSFLFPMPKLAIFPLILVWLGLGESSKIAVVAISAFFPVAVNAYTGIRNVDKFLIWNALSKGANQRQ